MDNGFRDPENIFIRSAGERVNALRKFLFIASDRTGENIPTSQLTGLALLLAL